ncbi:unnamed protein product [Staurois parvus]|uniref:Uncharacterized protein n=1 Tax=Staurois parvus TaxID=386267 RepID=A0ABN9CET3_9NEOB|nr:unnamed protein product [Staurois parvus]
MGPLCPCPNSKKPRTCVNQLSQPGAHCACTSSAAACKWSRSLLGPAGAD